MTAQRRVGRITQLQYLLLRFVAWPLGLNKANFAEIRQREVHIAPSARSGGPTTGGAYFLLWMFSVSYVRQLPCVSILNIRNAQPANFTYTHIWATARYEQGTARGLISPLQRPGPWLSGH